MKLHQSPKWRRTETEEWCEAIAFGNWKARFFNLTLIYVRPKPKSWPIYMYYQPFGGVYNEKSLKPNSTLFPEKLKHMTGCNLVNEYYSRVNPNPVSYEELWKNKPNHLATRGPGHDIYIKYIFCKVCNCRAAFVDKNNEKIPRSIYSTDLLFPTTGWKK